MQIVRVALIAFLAAVALICLLQSGEANRVKGAVEPGQQEANVWIKTSPRKDGPVSPGMGYETSLGYDPMARRVVRWGGHNQGGGGEQNAETWAFDPVSGKWELKEPNTSPPGVCCAQQNVFDTTHNRFVRFPAFSGSHGWQWYREIYLSNSTAWSYDLAANTWRDLRPLPAPRIAPLRCAAWDSDHGVAVLFGGEGSNEGTLVYDPHTNTWTRREPKVQPEPRSGGNMAYDAARKLHILFGSQFSDDPHTWAYDLRKNEWRDLKPATQPPTNRNDAVLAYDPVNRVVIAVVRVVDKEADKEIVQAHLETWTYDAGKNAWAQVKPRREPDGWGNRRRVMVFLPDLNLALLEVYVNPTERVPEVEREQQIWTYRLVELKPDRMPQPPTGVRVRTTPDAAVVRWQASATAGVTGYKIYRGEGALRWRVDLALVGTVEKDRTVYHDKDLKAGTIYHYTVRAVGREGQESTDSVRVRTQPHIVEDVTVSVMSPREVRLRWQAPAEDRAGYHVERAAVEVFSEDQVVRLKKDTAPLTEPSVGALKVVGPFDRLTREPLKEPAFTDDRLDLTRPVPVAGQPMYTHRFRAEQLDPDGKPYRYAVHAYRVRSINRLGVDSGPSPYFLTIPAAPQSVFAREDGEQCGLKWAANAEQGIKGYRVYRMEGPKINGPGQPVTRLTAERVPEPRYTDAKAGKDTRRYWVVAVDALGQEGLPSAPAWHYRQFRRYYEPFVGEWHQ